MTRRTRTNTEFGASVSALLTEARLTQTNLANSTSVSASYVNQIITGKKKVHPEWVDLVANTLKLQDKQRCMLHHAAARDFGYKVLDLTKE